MKSSGFSLIEILISVAILSAMSLLIYTTMGRALEGGLRVEKRDEVLHGARLGLGKLSRDLSQAFLVNANLKGANAAYNTGMKGDETRIDFTTLSHAHLVRDAKDTDPVSVGYVLEKTENGLNELKRRESPRLGPEIEEGGEAWPLIENVKEWKLQYYDSNKKEWVSEWDTSKISVLGRLPQAVKIDITVVEPGADEETGGREYSFSTAVSVELYKNEINF